LLGHRPCRRVPAGDAEQLRAPFGG
jgi:hypothetical protein